MSVLGGILLYMAGSCVEDEKRSEFKFAGNILKWGGIFMGVVGVVNWAMNSETYMHVQSPPPHVRPPTISIGPHGVFLPGISVSSNGVHIS